MYKKMHLLKIKSETKTTPTIVSIVNAMREIYFSNKILSYKVDNDIIIALSFLFTLTLVLWKKTLFSHSSDAIIFNIILTLISNPSVKLFRKYLSFYFFKYCNTDYDVDEEAKLIHG